jgi:hypothetical protein
MSTACKCMAPSFSDEYSGADTIFLGDVTEVETGENTGDITISFNVIACFKGDDCHESDKVQVHTPSSSASCGYSYFIPNEAEKDPVGDIFLVYSMIDSDTGIKSIASCSGTKRVESEAVPIVLELDSLYKLYAVAGDDDTENSCDYVNCGFNPAYKCVKGKCIYCPLKV